MTSKQKILNEFDRDFGSSSEINLDTLEEEVEKHEAIKQFLSQVLDTMFEEGWQAGHKQTKEDHLKTK